MTRQGDRLAHFGELHRAEDEGRRGAQLRRLVASHPTREGQVALPIAAEALSVRRARHTAAM